MLDVSPFELTDFSGGIIDDYVNADPKFYKRGDNLIVLSNKSLLSRPGSVIDDVTNYVIPAGNQRIGALINFDNNTKILVQSAKRIYYRNPSAYSTLSGPTGNDALNTGTTADHISHTQWHGHLFISNKAFANPIKVWKDGSTYKLAQAGLPELASSPTVTAGAVGTRTYLYGFCHKYTYTVGTEIFIDRGPITFVQLLNSADPSISANSIAAIPTLSNGASGNYDTTNIKIEIYRTVDGGDTFYRLGEVSNGTAVYNDNAADSAIQNNELLYTTGGVVENDPPPLSKYVHIVNGHGYWAHIKEGSETLKNTFKQSIKDDPDSVPADFIGLVEDEITGFNSIQSIPMVFCKKHIYRVEGTYDLLGRGFISTIRISDTAGCVSNRSIVQAENMVFWAGNDGFYASDGYRVIRITEHLISSYRDLLENTSDPERIEGTFDAKEKRIYWTVQSDSSNSDNDSTWVLDLNWGVSPTSCFTTASNGDNFRPSSLCYFERTIYRGDTRGYIFKHNESVSTDPKINTLIPASQWTVATIIWDFVSIATNFGSSFVRKWATRVLVTAKNRSNISIQVNAINDEGRFSRRCKEIRYRRNFVWGDPDFVWGAPSCIWNAEGLIEQWRWLPAKGIRVSYLQIQITNAYTIIGRSDDFGTATVNTVTKTATLDSAATSDWPVFAVDYYLSFEVDGYTKQYPVTVRTADTLTFSDTANTAPGGSNKWLLKGYRKEEVLNLLGVLINVGKLTRSQSTFESGEGGENA